MQSRNCLFSIRWVLAGLCLLLLSWINPAACQTAPAGMAKIKMGPSEDFEIFYAQFFGDSAFQASRIYFPLQGSYTKGADEFRWKDDEWKMLKTPKDSLDISKYKSKRKQKPYTVDEKAWSKKEGMLWDRRFALLGNRWFLVYAFERLE
jgi:hypothetical protein